jgi:hypothetical protein
VAVVVEEVAILAEEIFLILGQQVAQELLYLDI